MNEWLEKMRQAQSVEFVHPKAEPTPAEKTGDPILTRLRALYLAGRLIGLRLELPDRIIPDLERYLARYYGRTRREINRRDVQEIAALVCRLPFLEVN